MFQYPNFPIINIFLKTCMNFLLNKKYLFVYSWSIKFVAIKSSIMIFSLVFFENSLIRNSTWMSLIISINDQHYSHYKCHCLMINPK
jgi:hypothetical protein